MTNKNEHKLRALLLASIMALSIVAGTVAFAGSAAAGSYDLQATDGAGGSYSFVFANAEHQLPEGEASGNSNLTVKANDPPLPDYFEATLTIEGDSNVTFDDAQSKSEIEAIVFGEGGDVEDGENVEVTEKNPTNLTIRADYNGSNDGDLLLGSEDVPAAGVNVTNLKFDTGAPENVTLSWEIRGETAEYKLVVDTLQTDLNAADENSGSGAVVTAGAWNQSMVGADDASHLRVGAEDMTELPEEFYAKIETDSAGTTFNDSGSVSASSPYGDVHVDSTSDTEIRILVYNFDPNQPTIEDEYVVQLESPRFDVPSETESENLTWSILGETASYQLTTERLALRVNGTYEFPRGAAQEPTEGIVVEVSAEDRHTQGLHEAGETMTIEIPESAAGLQFDKRAAVQGHLETDSELTNPAIENVAISEKQISFELPENVDAGETVNVSGIRFNTTSVDERVVESASIQSGLDATYAPVDHMDRLAISSGEPGIVAATPSIDVVGETPTELANTAGGQPGVAVNITDTTGGQMGPGTDVVVALEGDSTITFDTSQTIEVNAAKDQNYYPTEVEVTDSHIVLSTDSPYGTNEGEYLHLSSSSSDALLFNTSDARHDDEVALAVTTSPGAASVTQLTEPVARGSVPSVNLLTDRKHVTVGYNETVAVDVRDDAGNPLDGIDVTATGDALEERVTNTSEDGTVHLTFTPARNGTINITAENAENVSLEAAPGSIELVKPTSGAISAASEPTVTVVVNGSNGASLDNVSVEATGASLVEPNGTTTDDGTATLQLNTTNVGAVVITAPELDIETGVPVVANLNVTPDQIEEGNETDITVTVTGAEDEALSNVTVEANGSFEGDGSVTTDENGTAVLTLNATNDTDIEVSAVGLTETIVVNSTDDGDSGSNETDGSDGSDGTDGSDGSDGTDGSDGSDGTDGSDDSSGSDGSDGSDGNDGTSGGGGSDSDASTGGGGGGGAAPQPSADMNVTDVSLSASEIEQGESLEVTVTVSNEGEADGSYEIVVRANTLKVASKTVDVAQGETKQVTVPVTFVHAGERKITVDGVSGGKVTISELEPENLPAEATAADAQPVVDMDEAANGCNIRFDENVTIEAITFPNASNGTATVADLESLPEGVPATPGPMIQAMDISVPAELENESATIRLSVNASAVDDREAVRLGRFHDGEWQTLEAQSVESSGGELVYEFGTPGFSTFAVFAQETEDPQDPETPQGDDDSTATPTDSDDDNTEEAGFGTLGMIAIAFIALVAVLLAAAGARMYQQNKL